MKPAQSNPKSNPRSNPKTKMMRSLFFGGILPILAFTLIEEKYGTLWGLVAGMVFGVGEILVEWRKQGRVETLTWAGNGLILGLGLISLLTREGIWFKLQPALIEGAMGLVLLGSLVLGRPFLLVMARKQGMTQGMRQDLAPVLLPVMERGLVGMTWRLALFFGVHTALAIWAALYASTTVWALLKGIGFTASMIVYAVVESLVLRYRIATTLKRQA